MVVFVLFLEAVAEKKKKKTLLRMQLYNSSNAASAVSKSHQTTTCPDVFFALLLSFHILLFKALVPLNV